MYHAEKCTVALSNEKGIYQHDIYSWQVFKDDLVKADNVTANSEIINMTLNDWLEHTTVEQREIFFDEIFDLFYATEANTFGEMSKSLSKNIMTILKKYRGIEENDRKTITSMIKLFVKAYFQVVRDKEKINFSNSVDYKKIENEARNKHMISINLGAN